MEKPNNYENTQIQGEFTPIELGGHIMEIKEVLEMKSRTGKNMLKVSFDFASQDVQPEYFLNQFRDDIRPEKKWPNAGTVYIVTEDQEGNCSKSFKTFTTSVEKSNPGFSVQWGANFAPCFKGKLVGGVFGVVHDYYNNKCIKKRQLRWFRSVDGVKEVDIPKEFETDAFKNRNQNTDPLAAIGTDDFMKIPDGIDEELPFN